jgi:signal transduction histidine kinase
MRERLNAAGARIEIGPLPPVWLDPPRLADLFHLLLDNSLRHGQTGQPLVLRINGDIVNDTARIRVADNGNGIAPEYRERVFRVFERLTSTGDGTGVGLAIVRRIAESTGGRAWIEETPGGGCTVNFELPSGSSA